MLEKYYVSLSFQCNNLYPNVFRDVRKHLSVLNFQCEFPHFFIFFLLSFKLLDHNFLWPGACVQCFMTQNRQRCTCGNFSQFHAVFIFGTLLVDSMSLPQSSLVLLLWHSTHEPPHHSRLGGFPSIFCVPDFYQFQYGFFLFAKVIIL